MMAALASQPLAVPTGSVSALLAQVRRTRLLERSAVSYVPRVIVLGVMIGAGLAGLVWLGQSWWQLAVAAYFAIVFAQLGFLGHDAGHHRSSVRVDGTTARACCCPTSGSG